VADELWLDDAIHRAGPGGHFVSEASTRANVRGGEWYLPGLGVHGSYDQWVAAGRPGLMEEAGRKADELLAAREEIPLGEDVERELERLAARAREADA
jgi:trimethylamine:corrinoid methyltransferase-like protein